MTGDGFRLHSDDLRSHAKKLGELSGRIGSAGRGAGGAPPDAFGVIGGFLPGLLQPLVDDAGKLINTAEESVSVVGELARGTADHYDQVDDAVAAAFQKIEGLL